MMIKFVAALALLFTLGIAQAAPGQHPGENEYTGVINDLGPGWAVINDQRYAVSPNVLINGLGAMRAGVQLRKGQQVKFAVFGQGGGSSGQITRIWSLDGRR